MGQAKKRGTFEHRKAAAIALKEVAKREQQRIFNPSNLIRPRRITPIQAAALVVGPFAP